MRKMASIQTIRAITPIECADAIELSHVNGWSAVVKVPEFFMFTIQVNGVKIPEEDYQMFSNGGLNVRSVPVVRKSTIREIASDTDNIVATLLKYVEGKSSLDGKTIREGSVFRSLRDSSVSFKVVSNQFLLRGGE